MVVGEGRGVSAIGMGGGVRRGDDGDREGGRSAGMGAGVLVVVVVIGKGKGFWGYRGERRCKTGQWETCETGKGWRR